MTVYLLNYAVGSPVVVQEDSSTISDHPQRLIVQNRVIATDALNANAIDHNCLVPRTTSNNIQNVVYETCESLGSSDYRPSGALVAGGGRHKKFDTAQLMPMMYKDRGLHDLAQCSLHFEFQCTLENLESGMQKNEMFIALDVPLADLVPNLTRPELSTVAMVHGFKLLAKLNIEQARTSVLEHSSKTCRPEVQVQRERLCQEKEESAGDTFGRSTSEEEKCYFRNGHTVPLSQEDCY
ncbi:hypothetical protein B0H16DRAFT_1464778 [Mycena metata]|uniref:Uncharacterized protein n=1 Tax=Mycena metata TaxID=1033252 RepID=A0AAD7N0P5_9AGAR|nr:hypothetical protein B0H16DRAFT_1464778 [Mycena metata]